MAATQTTGSGRAEGRVIVRRPTHHAARLDHVAWASCWEGELPRAGVTTVGLP